MLPESESRLPIYSTLGNDRDLGELVELFVEEMPERVAALQQQVSAADWNGLQVLSHQLKGAAGSYGFHQLTPVAARVESLIRQGEAESEIHAAATELIDLCQRARAGSPQ